MAETKILNLASFEDVETLKQTTKSQGEEISQVKEDLETVVITTRNLYKPESVSCPDSTITVELDGNIVIIDGKATEGSSVNIKLANPIPTGVYNIIPMSMDGIIGDLTFTAVGNGVFATKGDVTLTKDGKNGVVFSDTSADHIFVQTNSRIFDHFKFAITISDKPVNKYFDDVYAVPNRDGILSELYSKCNTTENNSDNVSKMNFIYVSTQGNDMKGDGTIENPYATIYHANEVITNNSKYNRYTIIVKKGTYTDLQDRYSGVGSDQYQGVICKDYVYYESEDIGNPQDTIILWDGANGLSEKIKSNIIGKCAFHIIGNTHTHIRGFKFIGKNLRYCMHMESAGYGAYSDWEVSDCVFDWGGRPDITDDVHKAPCIGIGMSPIERGLIKRCFITNSESSFGLQTHDNISYITDNGQRAVISGSRLVIEDCVFNNCMLDFRTLISDGRIAITKDIVELTNNIGISTLFKEVGSGAVYNYRFVLKANDIAKNDVAEYVV